MGYRTDVQPPQVKRGRWRMARKISYAPLFEQMEDKAITHSELRSAARISTSTWAGIQANKSVTLDTIMKLCKTLACKVEDVVRVE